MLNQNFFPSNQVNLQNKQILQRKKLSFIIIIIIILLFACYLLWQKAEQIKNNFNLSTKNVSEETNEQKIDQAEVAKKQFLQMKDDTSKIVNINDALAISQKYFTANLQAKVKQNLIDNLSEEEKLNLFWETVKGNVALIEDVRQINGTIIDDTHIRLTIETKFTIFELLLIWENNAWRYNGEEKITHIIDEVGKTYKVVTKNEAEYEIITDKNGKEIFRLMKDGQAILDDITSTNAAILINK